MVGVSEGVLSVRWCTLCAVDGGRDWERRVRREGVVEAILKVITLGVEVEEE